MHPLKLTSYVKFVEYKILLHKSISVTITPMKKIINFFFEAGMLNKTPRSGFQFLGTGKQSVAEHSFRVTLIGYVLAQLEQGADIFKVIKMCLFHDLPETRTGDLNYVNKHYVSVEEENAINDLASTLPFGSEIKDLLSELKANNTKEAQLVHDADQIELILELKERLDLGNKYASRWIHFARERLKTPIARKIASEIMETDSTDWWFEGRDHWWKKI